MSIYVEIRIRGAMEELWRKTQTPDLHARWDLRFTEIEYLAKAGESMAQRFLYATRMGFGLAIRGEGETVGSRNDADGCRTSALKFWSDDGKSLIREGAGYWQYIPSGDGIRFLTSYDYRVRFGAAGRVVDALVFRPLLGWATAWSFDRLRLWIEKGIDPAVSLQRSVINAVARMGVAFVWLYQGAIPKLINPSADELSMLRQAGLGGDSGLTILRCIGGGEIALGLMILAFAMARWPLVLTIVLMALSVVDVAVHSPHYLSAAFNPVSLNVLMIALSVVGLMSGGELPSARRCLRKKPEKHL